MASTQTNIEKITELKRTRNAVILVHNYQPPEIQAIADIRGDSLELSRKAAGTDADVIVFCGVSFMAETASILSPRKTVLLPDIAAGCPMADMLSVDELRKLKARHPGALVIAYVNTSAEIKAESDYCCTSANAAAIVQAVELQGQKIIFVPDKNLGCNIAALTGIDMVCYNGYCPVHDQITAESIRKLKQRYPDAYVMVHPECRPEVAALADAVISTGAMMACPETAGADTIIVGTEVGMLHPLRAAFPHIRFIPADDFAVCETMKYTTLAKIISALETMQPEIRVDDAIRRRALVPLERMLALS
jgi:quinolinate synthase